MPLRGWINALMLGGLLACGGSHSEPKPTPLPPTAKVIFPAGTTIQGTQLWESDGTPQGTRLLKRINPQGWAFPNSLGTTFTAFNGAYVFPAQDSGHGYELWRTDGTASGTTLIADAWPGATSGVGHSPAQPLATPAGLFFTASSPSSGGSFLWRIDGSSGAAERLLDQYQGDWDGQVYGMASWGQEAVFLGFHSPALPQHASTGLWLTNGLPGGTRLVRAGLSSVSALSIQSGRAIFLAFTESPTLPAQFGLWACDLATGDLQLLVPMNAFVPAHWSDQIGHRFHGGFALVEVQDGWDPARYSLWRTDGTPGGSFKLMDLQNVTGTMANAFGFQDRTYFSADDGIHGLELWVTDGTVAGTRLFKDLVPGTTGSFPAFTTQSLQPTGGFVAFKGRFYFGAGGPNLPDHVLWVSDGTPEGTQPLVSLPGTDTRAPKLPATFCVVGDTLYFSAQTLGEAPFTRQLWRTDGTPGGTQQVSSFDFGDIWNPIWSIQTSPRP